MDFNLSTECFATLGFTVFAVCLYSLFINVMFGHQSYWRITNCLSYYTSPTAEKLNLCKGGPNHQTIDLNNVDNDALHQILGYLNPFELCQVMKVSIRFRTAALHGNLWNRLKFVAWQSVTLQGFRESRPMIELNLSKYSSTGKTAAQCDYFVYIRQLMQEILLISRKNEDTIIILIDNILYDVSIFATEHPGGMSILCEHAGRDATAKFELAKHSDLAKELMNNYIIFNPESLNGSRGQPIIASRRSFSFQKNNNISKSVMS